MGKTAARLTWFGLSALGASGCASILGIEEQTFDGGAQGEAPDASFDSKTSFDAADGDGLPAYGDDGGPAGPPGILYYFPLAGDTKDYSGNGNDAQNMGATPTTGHSGKANSAYLFDGTSSYLVAPGTLLPIGSAARTVTVWVKPANQNPTYGGFVLWGGNPVPAGYFGLGNRGQQSFWSNTPDDLYTGWTLPTGVWTFVAAVYLPPNQMRFFNNGMAQTLALPSTLNTTASSLFIGATTTTDGTTWFDHYSGATDSVRIYGRSLSDTEIAAVRGLD
jgi:hypothetical protein